MAIINKTIEELFGRHRNKMLRLATLLLRDKAAAEDAVSEVFLSLISRSCDGTNRIVAMENAEGLLLTSVRNRCLDILKSRRRQEETPLTDNMKMIAEADNCRDEQRLQSIEKFINERLTEQTRRVIVLRFKEKLRYAEIAKELSISEAAVYKHLAKGIEKLKKEFNP